MNKHLTKIIYPYENNIILAGYVGSISHGVYDKELGIDDKDVMGFVVPPENVLLGLQNFGSRNTFTRFVDEWDVVLYTIKKAITLLLKGNPNIIGMLWLRDIDYIKITGLGQILIDNRDIFSSKQAYKAFVGYAHGQLYKMEHCKHKGYMGEKRKKLVDKFGYDCKNASHLIRLLKMGTEFMMTGELNVFRHDNNMLLGIKRGEWTLEQVKLEASRMFKKAEDAYLYSKLPVTPDKEKAEELLIEIQKSFYKY